MGKHPTARRPLVKASRVCRHSALLVRRLLQKRLERPQQRGLPKGMVKLDSRYSIFDRRNFCEITGVTPNGLKRHANRGTGRGRTISIGSISGARNENGRRIASRDAADYRNNALT